VLSTFHPSKSVVWIPDVFAGAAERLLSTRFGQSQMGSAGRSSASTLLLTHPLCFDTLAHSSALFRMRQKLNSFLFKQFRTLCQKTRVGIPLESGMSAPAGGIYGSFEPSVASLLDLKMSRRDLTCV
jgi:hypothetical protein